MGESEVQTMTIQLEPIGFAYIKYKGKIPRHWTVSDIEGTLVIHEQYREGLQDIQAGQRIVVLFYCHRSPAFTPELLTQSPPHRKEPRGVFSTCSPIRPNPIGMSVLEVLGVEGNRIHVRRIDLLDGTPILDIKPYVEDQYRNLEQKYIPDKRAN
jgi:tRNA-Thr(GGU) m(6)t(6)A37 methyltransferase TsaA